MKQIILKIDGMTCSACSNGLEKYLKKQKGIVDVTVNLVMAIATIDYENIKIKDIEMYIKSAGFKSLGEFKNIDELKIEKSKKNMLIVFGILAIILLYISMAHMLNLFEIPFLQYEKFPFNYTMIQFIFTVIFIIYGFDIIISGVKNLIHKMPNMDTLVSMGIITGFLYSTYSFYNILIGNLEYIHMLYFESTCIIIYFIKLGRYIENISKDKTKEAIKKLVQITPKKAILKKDGQEIEVSIDEIKKGDLLICKPGEKVAVDGIVLNGKSYFDESFITGESKPVLKEVNTKVIAGSINYEGVIEYKAEKIGKESTISEIVKLVVNATNTKSKVQKIADRISGFFVPCLITIAILSFIIYLVLGYSINDSINTFITILVIACPCALGLAVPLVIVVSNGICANRGIFIKESEVLEISRNINTVVLDKTGTLTYGKLKISKIYNYSDKSNEKLLDIVASLENNSTHPIATAFKRTSILDVTEFENMSGMGISGKILDTKYYIGSKKLLEKLNIKEGLAISENYDELVQDGNSIVYVIEKNSIIGLIGVRDIIREEAKKIINDLKQRNINVIMLTGDNLNTAKIIANEVGIDSNNIIANVMPDNKSDEIEKLINSNKKVLMVGDGINDAPALIKANIGVSINDGTDVAIDSANVVLVNNDLNKILDLIKISKISYNTIKQNLFWAFFYNLCMIPIAIGILRPFNIIMNPMFGSIAMTFSSISVVLNSLKIKLIERKI